MNSKTDSSEPALDPEFLAILACPETHQPLRMAAPAELAALNERIAEGVVANVGGEKVEVAVPAGLVREDGKLLYPVREGIPMLLVSEGLALA